MLEGAMSVGGLGWRPAAHRRGHAERASRGEVNLGRRHGRGRAERAGREEADLGLRAGETRDVAPGRALDGRETRGYGHRRAGFYGRRWAGGRSRRQWTLGQRAAAMELWCLAAGGERRMCRWGWSCVASGGLGAGSGGLGGSAEFSLGGATRLG